MNNHPTTNQFVLVSLNSSSLLSVKIYQFTIFITISIDVKWYKPTLPTPPNPTLAPFIRATVAQHCAVLLVEAHRALHILVAIAQAKLQRGEVTIQTAPEEAVASVDWDGEQQNHHENSR